MHVTAGAVADDVAVGQAGVEETARADTYHRRPPAGRVAVAIGAAGVALRLVLVVLGVPPSNSDEATMGIAALHIGRGDDHPVWFYGQAYMGTAEAYLAAPLVRLFGTHVPVLRVVALVFFAAFLLLAYRLTVALFTPGLGVLTVALLSLGADRVLKNEMIVAGGYPEILPAAALLMLLSVRLAATPPLGGALRRWAFGAWGLVAGVCVWTDWLVLPYVAAAGLLLAVGCGRDLRRAPGLWLAAGAVLGAAPLIAYNLTAAPGNDSLSVYYRLSVPAHAPLAAHLHGGVLVGVPMASGLCAPSHCAPAVMAWGVAYPVLLVLAVVLALLGVRRAAGAERLRELGRLALLLAAAVTLVAYVRSANSADTPTESARYLHPLLLSLPAVLWPLWRLASGHGRTPAGRRFASVAARSSRWRLPAGAALSVLTVTAVVATVAVAGAVPGYRRQQARQAELIAALDRLGVDRVYSEYWTCGRIAFATRERIVCAVLADDLTPGLDRYRPYRERVRQAHREVYVFRIGSTVDTAFLRRASGSHTRLRTVEAGGYHIHLPDRP